MRNFLVVAVVVIVGQVSMAAAVGDFAKYMFTSVVSSDTYSFVHQQQIISETVDKFQVEYTSDFGNGPQGYNEWKDRVEVCDMSNLTVEAFEDFCAKAQGTMEDATVTAGTFRACNLSGADWSVSVGSVPFCVIKASGTSNQGTYNLELIDYNK